VAVLLANVVAAKPNEVIPVIDLELQFVLFRSPAAAPNTAAVPENSSVLNVADPTRVNLINPVIVGWFITSLEANAHFQVLFVCHFVRFHHVPETGGINEYGFFHENMASSFDSSAVMVRTEAGRSGNDDHVAGTETGDCFFVGIESPEDAVIGQIDSAVQGVLCVVRIVSDIACGIFCVTFKGIGNGDNFAVVPDLDPVSYGSSTASAATDEGEFYFITSLCVCRLCNRESASQSGTGGKDTRSFQELTTRRIFGHRITFLIKRDKGTGQNSPIIGSPL